VSGLDVLENGGGEFAEEGIALGCESDAFSSCVFDVDEELLECGCAVAVR
jgi:hypothetical protein